MPIAAAKSEGIGEAYVHVGISRQVRQQVGGRRKEWINSRVLLGCCARIKAPKLEVSRVPVPNKSLHVLRLRSSLEGIVQPASCFEEAHTCSIQASGAEALLVSYSEKTNSLGHFVLPLPLDPDFALPVTQG